MARPRRRLVPEIRVDTRAHQGEAIRYDLGLAHEFQLDLLPKLSAPHAGLHVAGAYQPAYEVGGDFYEIIENEPGHVSVIIGDVSGKGVVAAMMMSRIMAEIARIGRHTSAPDQLLYELNQSVCELGFVDRFVTATSLELDLRRHRLSIANAGHLPAVIRRHDGEVTLFGHASGAPLGLLKNERYAIETLTYQVHDIVILVTDGVTEALEPNADPASGVLMSLVAACRPDIEEVTRHVLAAVHRSCQLPSEDDVAFLALQLC